MAKDVMIQLEEFASAVDGALGDNLVSLVLYGAAARAARRAKRAELNLLLILTDASPKSLRAIGRAVGAWVKSGQPAPLIFSETGCKSSSDVFPIEIEDMRQWHRLLRGRDPFDGLATTLADLRQELEREVRGKLLQLRTEYAATEADGKALGALLEDSAATFFLLFRAVLRLKGETPPTADEALVRMTAEVADLDPRAFEWLIAKRAGKRVPALKTYDPIGARYLEAIEKLVDFVDKVG